MSQIKPSIATILQANGYSVTKQRQTVFDLLDQTELQTMQQLYGRATGKLDRASLYRTIALFEKLGIARRINIGWKYKVELSDMFSGHHHHLSCLRCSRIIPINETTLEDFIHRLAADQQFQPTEHQIEIQGYCKDCTALALSRLAEQP